MNAYPEIELTKIQLNPANPRKACDPQALEELALSIKQHGVLEPIIVRPMNAIEGTYEIVAGERRFRASGQVGLKVIPAIIRELTDDEAFDVMMIENLQREDLTDREEAESFKAYIAARGGEEAIPALAEKTGIPPGYIRSRIRVLELPARLLKAWDKGELAFGHLAQFLRVDDDKERAELIDWFFRQAEWDGAPSVKDLAARIAEQAPLISSAMFKAKPDCLACQSNSAVQRRLFDLEPGKKDACLNTPCFKKKQGDFLTANWAASELARKYKTNGFRFAGDLDTKREAREFYSFGWQGKPGKKCAACAEFITVIEISGKVSREQACLGDGACYNAVTNPRTEKEKKTGERDPEAPRAAWHGEFFRDVWIRPRIEAKVKELQVPVSDAMALLLAAAVKAKAGGGCGPDEEVAKALGLKDDASTGEVLTAILAAKGPALASAARAAILWIVQDGQSRDPDGGYGFGTANRAAVGTFLGVDLAKEYAVNEEYLTRKTRAELLAFGKTFKLLKAEDEALKKTAMIERILAHGEKLVGKVPAEILGKKG